MFQSVQPLGCLQDSLETVSVIPLGLWEAKSFEKLFKNISYIQAKCSFGKAAEEESIE